MYYLEAFPDLVFVFLFHDLRLLRRLRQESLAKAHKTFRFCNQFKVDKKRVLLGKLCNLQLALVEDQN